jgi:hypothetical protein
MCSKHAIQSKQTFTTEKMKEMLREIVQSCHAKALDQQKAEGYVIGGRVYNYSSAWN